MYRIAMKKDNGQWVTLEGGLTKEQADDRLESYCDNWIYLGIPLGLLQDEEPTYTIKEEV